MCWTKTMIALVLIFLSNLRFPATYKESIATVYYGILLIFRLMTKDSTSTLMDSINNPSTNYSSCLDAHKWAIVEIVVVTLISLVVAIALNEETSYWGHGGDTVTNYTAR